MRADATTPPVATEGECHVSRAMVDGSKRKRPGSARRGSSSSRYGRAALASTADELGFTLVGERHHNLFKAAAKMGELVAGRELDEDRTVSTLVDMGRALDLTEADARRTVANGLQRGAQHPRQAPDVARTVANRAEAIAEVVTWWQAVQAEEWRGARACTTLRILAGFALLAVKAGKLDLAESYREVAEAAGVSVGTVSKHRSGLAPWVSRIEVGDRFEGTRSRWRILTRAFGNRPALPAGLASGLFPDARTLTDPAEAHWDRWSTGWRLYGLLDTDEAVDAKSLASSTGLHVGTVRRNLVRLEAEGLARCDGDGGWLSVDQGEEPAFDGHKAAARHSRHQHQRREYRRWRAKWWLARHLQQHRRRAPDQYDDERAAA